MSKKNTTRREAELMQPGISVNDWQEMPVYDEAKSSRDYSSEWSKRNSAELRSTACLNFDQSFLLIDEVCKIEYTYPRKLDEKGNLTEELDTDRPRRLVFSWYNELNSGHILKLYVTPGLLASMYTMLDSCKDWDNVFKFVSYKTGSLLSVNTKFRKFDPSQLHLLKNGKYAFLAYPALDDKQQPIVNKCTFTDTDEHGNERTRTYYIHILSADIQQLQLVQIEE